MEWTQEKLSSLSQEKRYELWCNAKRLGAVDLVALIETSGLRYSDSVGLKLNSPLGRAIAAIVNSEVGVAAAIDATGRGLPALAGVDPLLQTALKLEYANAYEATIQAGYLVAKMMRRQGFEKSGRQATLSGCIAKTGEIYVRSDRSQSQ